jgi:gamma-glutamyl-gamma-aminobutyrate hydrolase PuuD
MYVIAPKCYILKGNKTRDKEDVRKMKGVSVRLNDDINLMSYKSCLESSVPVMGINRGFMMIESNPFSHTRRMVKYQQRKKLLTDLHSIR